MIINGPTVGTPMPRSNYEQTDPSKADYLKGKDALDKKIQDAQTAANNAKTAADNAQNTANTALSKANAAEPALGYKPVQQGFLDGTGTNKIRLGWRSLPNGRGTLGVFVDDTDIGNIPMSNPSFGGCNPIENGGTAAVTRTDALKNLDSASGTPEHMALCYSYLPDTGFGTGKVATQTLIDNMATNSSVTFTLNFDKYSIITELPVQYGVVTLRKGVNNSFMSGIATDIIYGDTYVLNRKNSGEISWRRVLTNVLSSDDYGTTFPANAVTGQVYYLKG